ncbi:hypothetical protein DSL72_004288 [Monilinia vaccinii-corymbosi]|uniref:Uncharacterized protein n=1 Tax=Monilinia vaccinii-corymbosi TaxID=61207 RepID=A0A8A3P4B2_9HELO|nr:hypothetical protein DSL72_004288 [Monilinia vaccinii-corymbosi]
MSALDRLNLTVPSIYLTFLKCVHMSVPLPVPDCGGKLSFAGQILASSLRARARERNSCFMFPPHEGDDQPLQVDAGQSARKGSRGRAEPKSHLSIGSTAFLTSITGGKEGRVDADWGYPRLPPANYLLLVFSEIVEGKERFPDVTGSEPRLGPGFLMLANEPETLAKSR